MKTLLAAFLFAGALTGAVHAADEVRLHGLMDKGTLKELAGRYEAELKRDRANAALHKKLGIVWHNLATIGARDAAKMAVDHLEQNHKLVSEDQETTAYLGSAYTMVGRDAWDIVSKVRYVNRGLRLLDQAVYEAPDSFVVRLLRANNNYKLPAMFKRRRVAKEDFKTLVAQFEKNPVSGHAATIVGIYETLAAIARDEGDKDAVKSYLERAKTLRARTTSQ